MAESASGWSDAGHREGFAFVGRQDELRAMAQALREGPSVVLVEGEPGVGKSRLVREATGRMEGPGLGVLRGWCHPLREPLPFGPVMDALRQAAPLWGSDTVLSPATAVLAPYLPEITALLPAGEDDGAGAGELHQRLMRAVHDVLGALGPVVLAVEDVHWADTATRELLLLLARNPPQQLRLVLTYRWQELPGDANVLGTPYRRPVGVGGADLTLAPLDEEQVRELAASAIGPAAAGALGRQLYERSGGIALVAEEDLLVLAERRARAGGGMSLDGMRVPRALQEAVNSRVALLTPGAVAVVQAAAVLAVPADEEMLALLTGQEEDQAEEALVEALEASVLVEVSPGRYGFRHAMARQAVYERIVGPRRRRLHRRAIEALDGQDRPALVQVAHHARQLGDTVAWLPRARAAADHAIGVGDDGVAARLLRELLADPALPDEERTRAALEFSRLAVRSLDPTASVEALRLIVADPALAVAARGEVRLNLGRTLANQGAVDAAGELERAVEELEGARPELAAVALAGLSMSNLVDRPAAQDVAEMERAVGIVARSGDPVARATVLASRVTLLSGLGDPLADELLERLRASGPDLEVQRQCARALANAGEAAFWRGRDERAAELLDEAEELSRRTGYQLMEEAVVSLRIELDVARGRWAGLQEKAEAIAPDAEGIFQIDLLVPLAELDVAHGHWSRARRRLAPCLDSPYREGVLAGSAVLGRLDLLQGDPPAAWQTVQPALEALRHKDVWVWGIDLVPVAVQAALACGLREEAGQLTAEAARGTDGRDAPAAAVEVLVCRGLIAAEDGRTDEAVGLLQEARVRFEALGRVHRAARIAEQTGAILMALQPGVAAGHLQHALDVFTGLDATTDAARCRQILRDSGQDRPAPRGRRAYGSELSPREREVAGLLATRATNQDIAGALSLSPRTVEHHVASVLKKLGTTRDHVRDALRT
ncbi:AAA family ATPase [Streptomyces sp. NPDC051582]|uniref:ATP-binding protein n=1 Tax=Streptomyces sp. NPDC051582 TaxID=3155167 RepID=UPI0034498D80